MINFIKNLFKTKNKENVFLKSEDNKEEDLTNIEKKTEAIRKLKVLGRS